MRQVFSSDCGQVSLVKKAVDFMIDLRQGNGQRTWDDYCWIKSSETRSEDTCMEAGEEKDDFATIRREQVTIAMRHSPDDALKTQTTQVIRELAGGVLIVLHSQ